MARELELIQKYFPGAKLVLQLDPLPVFDNPTTARQRGIVRKGILECVRCELRERCSGPVPFDGPMRARFVVVGEGPGKEEDRKGKPFVGPSGKLLRAMMAQAKLDVDEAMFVNTVSCAPLVQHNKATAVEAPHDTHMMACRGNLMAQMELAQTRYVLLAGSTALKAFRGDLKISEVHGQVFVWMGKWVVMPIYHPAAVLRDRSLKVPTAIDLERFYWLVEEEVEPTAFLSDRCVKCGDFGDNMDPDAVPLCDRHHARYGGGYVKWRGKWEEKVAGSEAVEMFRVRNKEGEPLTWVPSLFNS